MKSVNYKCFLLNKKEESVSHNKELLKINFSDDAFVWVEKKEFEQCKSNEHLRMYFPITATVAVRGFFSYSCPKKFLTGETLSEFDKQQIELVAQKLCEMYSDFPLYLKNKGGFVPKHYLAALLYINHPLYETLFQQRENFLEEESLRENEKRRKEMEEEIEEKASFQRELDAELEKVLKDLPISGKHLVELCRREGVKIHPRTAHTLLEIVVDINTTTIQYKQKTKRKPSLDGCFAAYRILRNKKQA